MSETVDEGTVLSIATGHRLAVCQPWVESNAGWINPDSYSLHANLGDAWTFIRGVYRSREQATATPSSYTRVEGPPYPTVVTERLFREVEETRLPPLPQSNRSHGPSRLVQPILLITQYPKDCRNEAGDIPPAFADDKIARDWESLFNLFCFEGQEATSRFFSRVFAN